MDIILMKEKQARAEARALTIVYEVYFISIAFLMLDFPDDSR